MLTYLNTADILQVVPNAERDWHAKLPAFAGKKTCKLQVKLPAITGKKTCNRRKK